MKKLIAGLLIPAMVFAQSGASQVGFNPTNGTSKSNVAAALNLDGYHPEWYGAVCNGTTDDHVALQAALNDLHPGVKLVFTKICATSVPLYVPVGNVGLVIEGQSSQTGFAATAGAGIIATSGFSGAYVLNVLTYYVHISNLLINANLRATVGLSFANGNSSQVDYSHIRKATGDGVQVSGFNTPTTTTTSAITAAITTSFTVTAAALTGITLGGSLCSNLVIEPGTVRQDFVSASSSGNTITSSLPVYSHISGSTIQCAGNNNKMTFNSLQAAANGGWGLDVMFGTDNNGITVNDPSMSDNTLGGEIWSGSVSKHSGGNYENNAGPAIQLGDLTASSTNGVNGRAVVQMSIGPLLDMENTPSSSNTILDVCGTGSTVWYRDDTQFTPKGVGATCPLYTATGVKDHGFGCTIVSAACQFSTKTATSFLIASTETVYIPQLPIICIGANDPVGSTCLTASANNALVVVLKDDGGNLVPLVNHRRFTISKSGFTLQAGANTLVYNGSAAIPIAGGLSQANLATLVATGAVYDLVYESSFPAWFVVGAR